jgi:hypothetical protein
MIHVPFGPGEMAAIVHEHGATYAAWEYFSRWVSAYRDANPEDDRIDVFNADSGHLCASDIIKREGI